MKERNERYLYCVIGKGTGKKFDLTGVNNEPVYCLPFKEISVVLCKCCAKELKEKAIDLAITHQYVIDAVMKEFDSVIPFNAGTVVKGNEEKLREWTNKKYEALKKRLRKNRNRKEFSVRIFFQPKLKKESGLGKSVRAYIAKQQQLRKKISTEANKFKKDFYSQVKECVDEIKIRGSGNELEDSPTLLNLSCLVHRNNVGKLRKVLRKINGLKEFSVKFDGPWAPFSFSSIE